MSDPISPNPTPKLLPLSGKAQDTARQFEAVFIGQMAKLMLESVDQDGPFSGGHGEEMFRGVLAEKMGEEIASGRGIGLSDTIMAEIIRLQQATLSGKETP